MPSLLNGRADTVGPAIQLGSFFPERREIALNGETHMAWVTTNRRYPRPIQAQLDKYRNRYLSSTDQVLNPEVNDPEAEAKLTPEERAALLEQRAEAIEAADAAYEQFLTDALMALVPTLDQETVELIDRESIEATLRDLGYFGDPTDAPEVAVDESAANRTSGGSEEEPAPLTGDISTPDSATSIQPTV